MLTGGFARVAFITNGSHHAFGLCFYGPKPLISIRGFSFVASVTGGYPSSVAFVANGFQHACGFCFDGPKPLIGIRGFSLGALVLGFCARGCLFCLPG